MATRSVATATKSRIWNHFVERWAVEKVGGGYGVTGAKLRYIKPIIMRDTNFWLDIAHRHGLVDETPEALQVRDKETYEHCLGNFWGMIYQDLLRHGKVKA